VTISKREFTRNIYKYLKEGEYEITKDGDVEFVVTIHSVVTRKDVVTIKTRKEVVEKILKDVSEYGCGCKREFGKNICKEHQRY
jgi:hypothetical protein